MGEGRRGSRLLAARRTMPGRREPRRKLVMSLLSFAHVYAGKRDGPWRSERKAILRKFQHSLVHQMPSSQWLARYGVINITQVALSIWTSRSFFARGVRSERNEHRQRIDARVRSSLERKRRRISGSSDDSTRYVRRGLVPLGGAANALAEIDQRDVAQQFPRLTNVGQRMPDVARADLRIGGLALVTSRASLRISMNAWLSVTADPVARFIILPETLWAGAEAASRLPATTFSINVKSRLYSPSP